MKTIKNRCKQPIRLGVHTLNYLESITVNESDIPEYIEKRIKSLQISGILEVISVKGEESTNPKLTLEQLQEEEYKAKLISDSMSDETEVIIEEPIIETAVEEKVEVSEVIEEVEQTIEVEETVEPKPKKRGRPKKEEGNE